MITYNRLYPKIYNFDNLVCAWKAARRGKTRKEYVLEFEKNLERELLDLQFELKNQFYKPLPLKTFILRDPKTRVIAKSDFRDRIIHHALVRVIEPIFDKAFIYDSCANRKRRGTLFAVKQFDKYKRKVFQNGKRKGSFNNRVEGYCFKADIKHYFQEVEHKILLSIIKRKISDDKTLWLIGQILKNNTNGKAKGMPLGNITSQIFANVYLNELDQFVKHKLKEKFYIRYVDDFVIIGPSRQKLIIGEKAIEAFLRDNLKLELHPHKSRIIPLSRGIDFAGFRIFYHCKLLRKRSIRKMGALIREFERNEVSYSILCASFQGWQAHAKRANTFTIRRKIAQEIAQAKYKKLNLLT